MNRGEEYLVKPSLYLAILAVFAIRFSVDIR